jgi:hypothetical protein
MVMRLLPGPRLLPLLALWALLALALPWWPVLQALWLGLGLLILLALLIDAILLCLQRLPKCSRQLPGIIPLGMWRDISLEFQHAGARPVTWRGAGRHRACGDTEGT